MNFTDFESVGLFLNRETLTSQEIALVERLEQLVQGTISAYCHCNPFVGPFCAAANRRSLEYVLLILMTENFYRITRETTGWTQGKFGNIEITFTDDAGINALCLLLLQPFRQTSLCG